MKNPKCSLAFLLPASEITLVFNSRFQRALLPTANALTTSLLPLILMMVPGHVNTSVQRCAPREAPSLREQQDNTPVCASCMWVTRCGANSSRLPWDHLVPSQGLAVIQSVLGAAPWVMLVLPSATRPHETMAQSTGRSLHLRAPLCNQISPSLLAAAHASDVLGI